MFVLKDMSKFSLAKFPDVQFISNQPRQTAPYVQRSLGPLLNSKCPTLSGVIEADGPWTADLWVI